MKYSKKILITGAGGTPSTNFVRSLNESPEKFYFIGVDSNEYYLQRAETHQKYLCPLANDKKYIPFIQYIINKEKPDFIYSQPDQEIFEISKNRDKIECRYFLPSHTTIEICQDKFKSYDFWKKMGIDVPNTIILNNKEDLKFAFINFGPELWIRAINSPGGGKGSLKTDNIDMAISWINYHNGWNNFVASECLSPNSITWQSIWKNGNLVVAQTRKRLYWEFSNRAISGVTGITGTGITISNKDIDQLALKTIFAIDEKPNGIFSVDFTYSKNNELNPTEINIGRFFTTHLFFTRLGLNMPYIFIKKAFNEPCTLPDKRINPLPDNYCWIRGMDFQPVLCQYDDIIQNKQTYEMILHELS